MVKKSVFFPIVFHFHQPIDNFEWVYEDCYNKSYLPLIKQIYNHPKIKFTLHFTGSLLKWLLNKKAEFKNMLVEIVKRGQAEIIGGGYYEPIFAIIPEKDRIEQIRFLTESVKDELGYEVKGAWLSERVWEPNYPSFLVKAGLTYIIVDDNHLRGCGLSEEDTFYSYTTEDSGNVITVFPINEPIRYLAPWHPAQMTIDYLEKNANEKGDRIIVFLSDAEKMGVWGTTYELCYVKGHPQENYVPYIESLFSKIEKSEIIKPITLSEYIDLYKSKGLIYLPTASYDKMEQWVLPTPMRIKMENLIKEIKDDEKLDQNHRFPKNIKLFLKGGFWRYFLVKYPESNNMHKKMYYVRNRLELLEQHLENTLQGTNSKLKFSQEKIQYFRNQINYAWNEIYKSQCNDCYWHGQFGGIYLHFLRFFVYQHLINAENVIDSIESELYQTKIQNYNYEFIDFDKDSNIELVFRTPLIWFVLKLSDGGSMFELDYKPNTYNILNTLTRWFEAYHEPEKVVIDRWRKSALRDHIILKNVTLKEFLNEKYEELGSFVSQQYNAEIIEEQTDSSISKIIIKLTAIGEITYKNIKAPLNLIKTISIVPDKPQLHISYSASKIISNENNSEKSANNSSIDWDEIIENLCLAVDIPFMFSGDQNKFKCLVDDKTIDFFTPAEILFSQIKFMDPQYNQTFAIEVLNKEKSIDSLNKNVSRHMSSFKYQIICYARTNTGYKDIYEGINIVLRVNLKELISSNKKFEFIIKLE
ncbi:MAG: alpha-amylase/4-alpha-glucanotransferase domain-containing protein [Promethearchaeota archaeon]